MCYYRQIWFRGRKWWCMSVVLALGKLKQEDGCARLASITQRDPVSKKRKKSGYKIFY